ncbi:MAG: hypothetical protein ACI4AA_03780 [Lachnospiraceae bacterium]
MGIWGFFLLSCPYFVLFQVILWAYLAFFLFLALVSRFFLFLALILRSSGRFRGHLGLFFSFLPLFRALPRGFVGIWGFFLLSCPYFALFREVSWAFGALFLFLALVPRSSKKLNRQKSRQRKIAGTFIFPTGKSINKSNKQPLIA